MSVASLSGGACSGLRQVMTAKSTRSTKGHTTCAVPLRCSSLSSRSVQLLPRKTISSSSSRSAGPLRALVRCETEGARKDVKISKDAFGDTVTIYPTLESLPAVTYLDNKGFVSPELPKRYAASVFAVLDEKKNVIYVGFSKDVRNTLRRLLARRTDLCFYYKLFNFEAVDPEGLMACRKQWFSELGDPPTGNADAAQRMRWEQPQKGEAISDTQMLAAAKDKCKQITKVLLAKGFKEPILFDQNLLQSGMCELLDTKGLDEEELARLREEEKQLAARQVKVEAVDHRGRDFEFNMEYEMIFQTNGGWMIDVNISKDDQTTAHRVIVSKHMVESVDARSPKELVEKAFAVLLGQKDMQRRTEGLISPMTFPINYFTVSEVEQWYPEAFQKMFDKKLPGGFWHFARKVDYSVPAPISTEGQLETSS